MKKTPCTNTRAARAPGGSGQVASRPPLSTDDSSFELGSGSRTATLHAL